MQFNRFLSAFRTALVACLLLTPLFSWPQTPVTTWHYDNARTSADTTEYFLTPANVNSRTFARLFTQPVDGFIVGHPLYLPNLNIPGQGTHNVVFVATMHDSVYAFDANNPSIGPLWVTSLLTYSPAGATTVPESIKKGAGTTGWIEVGVVSTPVIDPATGTLYVVCETYENSKVFHRLHALDVTTGQEKLGGPATIAASYTFNGTTSVFKDLYQMNRPGLLLANGHIYIAFGSNCCNAYSQGWVISYNATTLQQEGAFDAEPGKTLASIWQKGAGISADSNGNVYAETGEGFYSPGTNLSTSVLKLSQVGTSLTLADWFTPFDYQFLSANDQDMAEGILILPDQLGPVPHEMISIGKQGTVYLLNRDNLGHLCAACTAQDTQIVQELTTAVGSESGTPVYWNGTVFFTGVTSPIQSYSLVNGLLATPPLTGALSGNGGHALITANGDTNGVLWGISGNNFLWAVDATSLATLYTSNQAPNGRDTLPHLAHFAAPVAADGRVFVGTQNSLAVYGLMPLFSATSGDGQSATVVSTLPVPLTLQATDPYTGNVLPGVSVNFSDGGKGGIFTPATAITDSSGNASAVYKLPSKAGSYTLTASAAGYATATFSETAVAGAPKTLARVKGNTQTAPVATLLPVPLVSKVTDSFGNVVQGVTVSYSDKGAGGIFSPSAAITDSKGLATTSYTTPTKAGIVKIVASSSGLSNLSFSETVTAGPSANLAVVSGNGQSAAPGTPLASPLSVKVTDQYGNAVPGVSVTFDDSGAGGTFATDPVPTSSTGVAGASYTTPSASGTVTISARVSGVSSPATFTVTVH